MGTAQAARNISACSGAKMAASNAAASSVAMAPPASPERSLTTSMGNGATTAQSPSRGWASETE
jgi:hypothetical protein